MCLGKKHLTSLGTIFFFKFLNLLLQNRFKSKNYVVQLASSSLSVTSVSSLLSCIIRHLQPPACLEASRLHHYLSSPVTKVTGLLCPSFACFGRHLEQGKRTQRQTTATRSFLICPNETAGFRSLQCLLTKAKRMLWVRQSDTVS